MGSAEIVREDVATVGYTTHLLRSGEVGAPPVLLLHGGGVGAQAEANWMRTLPTLGEQVQAIAPDLVGFGATTHPDPVPYGPAAWLALRVEQLVALLDHYGIERAHLVGNSLGGALTLNFVLAHPERVSTIILMGSAGAPFKPGEALMRLLGFYGDPTPENMRAILEDFVYDLDGFGGVDALIEARVRDAMRPEVKRSFEAMFRDPEGQPVRELALPPERVQSIQARALIVHGRDDRIIPMDASLWLLEQLPHGRPARVRRVRALGDARALARLQPARARPRQS
ncbi:MAG TPA: alpha/beta hydrolase [Solirubrobacteraceae bacterium]|jgi:2-hydroxymuconate-semialdehyde hydrolase|nr:alpha/beta hydrolase [Solirubrobacteraceae bacterium]